jgi:DNA-binding NarL/FixJ family response regulator
VLSPLTVKTHVSRILTKLGLRDRAQLVVAA